MFLNGYTSKIYGRELVGKVSLSQKNIALTLTDLENDGILSSIQSGNRKYYELNLLNPLLIENVLLFENFNSLEFLEKNKRLIDFFRQVGGDIVCVFGSYASDKATKNSDLDLLIVGKVDSLSIQKLGKKYGIDVQIFNVSSRDFAQMIKSNKEIYQEILKNHVLVKGGDLFVGEVIKSLV